MRGLFTSLFFYSLLCISCLLAVNAAHAQGSGKDYVYVTEATGTTAYIWRGNRDGTFTVCPRQVTQPATFLFGVGNWAPEGSFFVDLNNDGTSDYIRCYEANNYIDAYINDGSGNFTRRVNPISNPTGQFGGYDGTEIDGFGDANGDALPDYMNVNSDVNPNVSIYLNTSATTLGTFAGTAVTFNLEVSAGVGYGVSGRSASTWSYFSDLNSDGKIDFVSMNGQKIYVWLGTGSGATFRFGTDTDHNGRYEPNQTQTVPAGYTWTGEGTDRAAFLADINGDNYPDYVFALQGTGTGRGILYYPGLGNGRFTIPTGMPAYITLTVPAGLGAQNMCGNYTQEGTSLTDVNGDGKLDWVFMKSDAGASSGIYVWLGTGSAAAPFTTTAAVTLTASLAVASGYVDGQIGRMANILTSAWSLSTSVAPGGVGKGLSLWARADSLGGAMTNGAKVSLWKNKAQNYDITQSLAANQPTYKTNQINYNPAVVFSGINDNTNGSWMNFADQQDIRSAFWMVQDNATDQDYDQVIYGDDNTNPSNVFFHSGAGYLQWPGAGVAATNIWHKDGKLASYNTYYDYGPLGKPNLISVVDTTECIKAANLSLQATAPTRKWNGPMSEIILYNRSLSLVERQKIESYLALKYGVSLDQAIAQNYLASDGSVIWSAAANTSYKNNITGIGRDDASGLIQKQSRNISTSEYGNLLYMGLGSIAPTNQTNAASFTNDKSFLLWADDGAALTPVTNTVTGDGGITLPPLTCGSYKRLGRIWRIQKTGTVNNVEVKFALGASISMGTNINDFYLAVNTSNTFSGTITKLYTPTSFAGNTVTFDNVNFADGQYFTLIGRKAYAPGNVSSNLKFWLKADDGIGFNSTSDSLAQWYDQSISANYAYMTTAANQPVYRTAKFNFNPSVSFTGAQMMLMNQTLSNTDFKLFCAGMPYNSGTWNTLFRNTVSKGDHHLIVYPSTPYLGYYDQNYGFRNSTMLLSYTAPSIMDMLYTTSTHSAVPRLNGKTGTTLSPINYTAGANDLYQHFGSLSYGQPFGNVGEVIVYNGPLTAAEVQRVESYLAIKWGIAIDQTTATDYLASDGSVIWRASTNGAFKYHVTGIGRDDCSGLLQKQSRNADTTGMGHIISMGMDTIGQDNFANNGIITADKNFLLWSDNNASLTPVVTSVTGDGSISLVTSCGNNTQLGRTWRVQKTGTAINSVQVQINVAGLQIGRRLSDFYLAVNNSSAMSGVITKLYPATKFANNVVTFDGINFTDGQYFTLIGMKIYGPANITAGIGLWLDASEGVVTSGSGVTEWDDLSGKMYNAYQSTAGIQPTYNTSSGLMNFNPSVGFNGANQYMVVSDSIPFDSLTIVSVHAPTISGRCSMSAKNASSSNTWEYYPGGSQYGEYNGTWYPITGPVRPMGQPYISAVTSYPGAGNSRYRTNGLSGTAGNIPTNVPAVGSRIYLGLRAQYSDLYYAGTMTENIIYKRILTAAELNKVQSYLAVKYGVTLDQATATNYTASDGTIFWNATTNAGFKYHITGIGRDDCSQLMQKQSQNVDTSASGSIVTIASRSLRASNALNPDTILSDHSYLMWADNNASLNPAPSTITGDGVVSLNASCGSYKQLGRIWRIQKTGNPVSFVQVQINVAGVQLGKRAADFFLAVNGSTPMTGTITKLYKATSFTNNVITFDSIAFSDGQYFTVVGRRVYGPAGISNGIALWLNAEDGVTLNGAASVAEWDDISGNLYNALQANTATQPTDTSYINFNPAIRFNGANQYMSISHNIVFDSLTIFSAGTPLAAGTVSMSAKSGNSQNTWEQWFGNFQYGEFNGTWYPVVGPSVRGLAQPYFGTVTSYPGAGNSIYRVNGLAGTAVNIPTNVPAAGSPIYLGLRAQASDLYYNGMIGEHVMYSRILSAAEINKVQSYLALKYGITMDQTTATNYTASDGTIFWNAATNGSYKYRITGIGRDDCSDLIQKVSCNQDTLRMQAKVTMGLNTITSTNAANTAVIATDKNFMMWADNNASPLAIASAVTGDGTITLSASCGAYKQSGRTWRIQKTGTAIGPVQLQMDLTGINLGLQASDFYLVINSSATFNGTVTRLVPASSFVNNIVTFDNISFTDGQYFTVLGTKVFGPGNVTAGLSMWLRADTGVVLNGTYVSQWTDLSNNGNSASQSSVTNQPAYLNATNLINFNPCLSFNGSGSYLIDSSGILKSLSYTGAAAFSVAVTSGVQNQSIFNEFGASGNQFNCHLPWNDGNVYWDACGYPSTANRLAAAWGGTVGVPYLWSLSFAAAGTQTISRNALSLASSTTHTSYAGAGNPIYVGSYSAAAYFFNGQIGELAIYNQALTATQAQQVNSYLAIKYGLSLDQTVATNYLASDATSFWTAAGNGIYKYRITGIGRDDCSALLQKQSRNQDTSSVGFVTMALNALAPTNAANVGSITTDKSFLMWADNNISAAPVTSAVTTDGTTTLNTTCGSYKQLGKTWRVQKTGTGVGAVQVIFNLNGITKMGKVPSDFYLAINSSATFGSTVTQLVQASGVSGYTVTFNNVSFSDGQYFTLVAHKTNGPANITSGILAWYKADDAVTTAIGSSVSAWDDQSGNFANVIQPVAANQPTYNTTANLINFNPSLTFNGSTNGLYKSPGILRTATYSGASAFVLANTKVVQTGGLFFENTSAFQFDAIAPWSDANVYWDGGSASGTSRLQTAWGGTVNTPYIWTFHYATSPSQSQNIYRNGLSIAGDATAATFTGNNSTFYIGNYGPTTYYNGQIGEVILYGQSLTATQRQQINSYLAVKWGVTMDQSTATNYLASDGSVIWNATTNSAYKNRITGIGRDDCSELLQLQSRNQDTTSPGYVTIGVNSIAATNADNTGTILTDKSFEIWGDDGGTGMSTAAITGDGTTTLSTSACRLYRRMVKTYKVAEAGNIGGVQVQVSLNGGLTTLGKVASDFYLAINASATFTGTITQLVQATSYVNGILTFNNVDFSDGQYFTVIGQRAQGPANITTGLKLWLKAEDGVILNASNVSEWDDQGPLGNNVIQGTAANQPLYNSLSNLINYNPTVQFNGSNSYLIKAGGMLGTSAYTGATSFVVSQNSVIQNSAIFAENTTTGQLDVLAPYGDSKVYWDCGGTNTATNRLSTPWGGVNNRPYIWSFNYATSPGQTQRISRDGLSIGNDATAVSYTGNNSALYVGSFIGPASYYNGQIGEVLFYSQSLTATQIQQINSYLAIKWGKTFDQSTPTNYLAADGTTIWSAATNGVYKNRITGIGRDDCSDLMQLQSRNVDTAGRGNMVAIGVGSIAATNGANSSPIATDKTFLIWADNNDNGNNIIDEQATDLPAGVTRRIDRVWRVQATGAAGALQIDFDLSGVVQSGTQASDFTLLVSTNGSNFAGTTTAQYAAVSFSGNVVTFSGVTLSNGDFFTLATKGCSSLPIQLTPLHTTVTATAECPESNGWTYYYDIANPTRLIFAIQHDPLNGGRNSFKATASVTSTAAANTLDRTDAVSKNGNFIMPRYWNVNITGSMPDPVNVRFYYDTAELRATQGRAATWKASVGATNISGPLWFKTQGHDFAPADVTPVTVLTRLNLTAATGTEQNVDYAEFDGVTSFSGGSVAIRVSNQSATLPVELISFAVVDEQCFAIAKWSTASEINSYLFTLQSAPDAMAWKDVTDVPAAGNSNSPKNYTARAGYIAGTAYYRLKMTDIDGSYTYSPIVSLETPCLSSGFTDFMFYPNPTGSRLYIQSNIPLSNAYVKITNALGQSEMESLISDESGSGSGVLDMTSIPAGVHYVSVTLSGKTIIHNIVKIDGQ